MYIYICTLYMCILNPDAGIQWLDSNFVRTWLVKCYSLILLLVVSHWFQSIALPSYVANEHFRVLGKKKYDNTGVVNCFGLTEFLIKQDKCYTIIHDTYYNTGFLFTIVLFVLASE